MENIKLFTENDINKLTNFRKGEIKFGERIDFIPNNVDVLDYIKNSEAQYVIFGISEDIGIRANSGRPGSLSTWEVSLKALLNIQHNKYCKGYSVLILGSLNLDAIIDDANKETSNSFLSKYVEKIDKEVVHVVSTLVKLGKIPIIIGGGHNNSYGAIKGCALAKGKPINTINFDAHTDFRALEGRHSGNGFSYAYSEGFLDKYFIFGIHENYTSKAILSNLKNERERIKYNTFEEIVIREEKNYTTEIQKAYEFITDNHFGIEIDLDSLPNIPSSAMTPSGFSVNKLRQFIHYFAKHQNNCYLHICEGAPEWGDEKNPQLLGKLISYLITDFIKSKNTVD